MTPEQLPDPLEVARDIVGILDRVGIPYLIAGSLASSVHGEPRSTNDIDLLVDMTEAHVSAFLREVEGVYYCDERAIREALRSGHGFNAIHMGAAVKVDFFPAGDDAFERERLAHRASIELATDPLFTAHVDTAEHTVLRKLEWYRRGGEVSDRQWLDVVAVLRAQVGRLDARRLGVWADRLGVSDLLQRARSEAG